MRGREGGSDTRATDELTVEEVREYYRGLQAGFFADRELIIAANRGPVVFEREEDGGLSYRRGEGGLVTALVGMCRHAQATWIACARTEADAEWAAGEVELEAHAGDGAHAG
ncbi:MAG: hypothetical protein ACOC7N_04880, partial [Chloroflexota bacterium]